MWVIHMMISYFVLRHLRFFLFAKTNVCLKETEEKKRILSNFRRSDTQNFIIKASGCSTPRWWIYRALASQRTKLHRAPIKQNNRNADKKSLDFFVCFSFIIALRRGLITWQPEWLDKENCFFFWSIKQRNTLHMSSAAGVILHSLWPYGRS